MSDPTDLEKTKRKKLARVGALAGVLAALLCHSLPHEYQAVCTAVTKAAALSCGGHGG